MQKLTKELKIILIILRRQYCNLKYCPFLPVVTSIFLVYLSQQDTLKILKMMLEASEKMLNEDGQLNRAEQLRGLRWYFPMDKLEFHGLIETFMSFMTSKSSSIRTGVDRLEMLGADSSLFIKELFSTFFLEFVPLDIINTLFVVYLNEGIKILFRLGYGFFKYLAQEIASATSIQQLRIAIKNRLEYLTDKEKRVFINLCFQLRIVKIKTEFSKLNMENVDNDASYICNPSVQGSTKLLEGADSERYIKEIYEHVPHIYKAHDLKSIYLSWNDGLSLQHLVNKAANEPKTTAFLLLIQDSDNCILGAFFCHPIEVTTFAKRVGAGENFVFRLNENSEFYKATGKNESYFEFNGDTIFVGSGGKGSALMIDSDLLEGFTQQSDTFGNKILAKRESFKIKFVELFAFF